MRCAECKDDFPMHKLRFVRDGKVPKINMPRHKAVCYGCSKKVPIDKTSKEPPF